MEINSNLNNMKESFTIKETFNATPSQIYKAWLDSEKHAKMVDGDAECGKNEGDSFTIWNGYIEGKNISLTPNKEIIQSSIFFCGFSIRVRK